jgi:pyruvate dehydrogenase E1 component alpha subunit
VGKVSDRAAGYGIPGIHVPENDALAVYDAVGPAIERARSGGGPSLIEIKTDRYFGHFQGDAEVYRAKDEVTQLRLHDPLAKLSASLKASKFMSDAQEGEITARVKSRVAEAFAFARSSAYPAPQDALNDVFA